MKPQALLGSVLLSLALVGCGGGGGGSAGGTEPRNFDDPTYDSISGLYHTTKWRAGENDEGYMYITPDGVIEQYNDLNDAYAGADNMNCYRRAIKGDVNAALDGKKLTNNSDGTYSTVLKGSTGKESTLTLTRKDDTLVATYNGSTGVRLIFGNGANGVPGPLVLGGVESTEPTIETIRGMLCSE